MTDRLSSTVLVRGSQYKRKLPLIAKVSHRSLDGDFWYSGNWGK